MYDENNPVGGIPEEIDYTPKTPDNNGLAGVSAPALDDFGYVSSGTKKEGPTGVAAPVLDDMDTYTPDTAKKGTPTGVTAPVLDDTPYNAAASKKTVLSDEDIIAGLTPELKERFDSLTADQKQQIIDMRRSQLGAVAPAPAVTAPVLDEDNYTPPPKTEKPAAAEPAAPVTAPVLDDEPEQPKYTPKYVDEDLEKAKQEASKKAVSSQLVKDQKDEKESLRMMLELKEQLRQQEAEKGFKISIVLAVVGVIAAVVFYLLYSGKLGLDYKNGLEGFSKTIEGSAMYISLAVAICAIALVSGIKFFKSIASVVYLLFGIIQVFPGLVMIPQHEGSLALVGILYAVSLGCTVAVFFMLAGSEAVGQYFNK